MRYSPRFISETLPNEEAQGRPLRHGSGWYFSHPDSCHFGLGKITKEQVEDYAQRKGLSVEETERWLGSVLAY